MNAIGNVQARDPRNTIQIERHERDIALARELAIDLAKFGGVCRAEIRRCFHTSEDDLDALRLRARDDLGEVAFELSDRKPAQAVIRTELDDENLDVARERPVEPAEPACRCVA